MKRILTGLFLMCVFLSLLVSCGKRENPVRSRYLYHDPFRLERVFNALQGNDIGDLASRNVYVYLPPMYDPNLHTPQLPNQGFSVLYLLHDFGEDYESFISVYKVGEIADQLIAEGEIQPMIIIMPDASSISMAPDVLKKKKSGTFYTNSALLGQYEDYIVQELMAVVDSNFHTYVTKPGDVYLADPQYRAISGLGMGGYGALKIAMDHDTLFHSVSAMSPFASLESFLNREIINKVFEENGIASNDFSYSSYKKLDPWESSQHPDKTYSQLVFVMAAAFSPHDKTNPDTTSFFTLLNKSGIKYGVDLPFDSTRTIPPGSPIWQRWLFHDLKTNLINDPNAFGDLKIYFDCGDQDQLNLLEGARAFDQILSLYGKEHTYSEYSGYPGYPATHNNFIYDQLVEILKFHSRNFPPPAYRK